MREARCCFVPSLFFYFPSVAASARLAEWGVVEKGALTSERRYVLGWWCIEEYC